ncbi:M23 family metallopeptidase [Hyphomonas johnsonii]|uniref:M23 family metallopeptidase n=1 Tax=Hyphomonas johnsonii TaxID=81031 RepID=UPI000A979FCA|nr:M23 family metallopeptidase [Hyphomonas johnsonii]
MKEVTETKPQLEHQPKRNLSQGLKSLAVLFVLGTASAIAGLVMVDPAGQPTHGTAAAATPPPLATTLLSATDLTDPVVLEHKTGTLKSRQTLTDLVVGLGASHQDANSALQTLYSGEMLDARRLRPGLVAEAYLDGDTLKALSIRAEPDRSLLITREQDGAWSAAALNARLTPSYKRVAAAIDTSIYETARSLGAGDQQVVDFADAFAYDVDFQREIYPGDRFEIVYETFVDEHGNPVKSGDVVFASLDGQALSRDFYRFTPSDDQVPDYFDSRGESATKFLMKTPINGARLSSSFGKRRHPISGYTRLHKGTDFAAPSGTPVFAAGHGIVERASRYGGYGNYVKIKHANGYVTAYAHLSRYGKGMKSGRRVRQGDVIGYVGSTGASTGPHLHYEVYIKGVPVNAMRLKLPTGRKLAESPDMLSEFAARKAEIDQIRADLGANIGTARLVSVSTATP